MKRSRRALDDGHVATQNMESEEISDARACTDIFESVSSARGRHSQAVGCRTWVTKDEDVGLCDVVV